MLRINNKTKSLFRKIIWITLSIGLSFITLENVSAISAQTGLKTATPTIGKKKYTEEVVTKLKKLNLTDDKEYKITIKITILSTGVIQDVEIIKSPNLKESETIKKIFKDTAKWIPAKRNGAMIDSEVKITVKVK